MTQPGSSTQPQWPLEPLQQPSAADEITGPGPSDDLNALLTDLQHAALRWVASGA